MNVNDPTLVAELVELVESVQIELDAIHHEVYDLGNALDLLRRKLINVCENLADLLGERPAPTFFEFEEVDR